MCFSASSQNCGLAHRLMLAPPSHFVRKLDTKGICWTCWWLHTRYNQQFIATAGVQLHSAGNGMSGDDETHAKVKVAYPKL